MGEAFAVENGLVELVPDPDEPDAWTLVLNGMPQSHVNLADPVLIAFDYVRRTVEIIDLLMPGEAPLRVLHLGGGGMSLPRVLSLLRPGSEQTVVEVDALLSDLVQTRLPLHPDANVDIVIADALDFLRDAPADAYDVIIADMFTGAAVPQHVTTPHFVRLAHAALAPKGCYIANVIDGRPLFFAQGLAAAVRAEFHDAAVVAETEVLRGVVRSNLLLVGADQDVRSLTTALPGPDPYDLRVLHGSALTEFLDSAQAAGGTSR
ncbi:MAG: fused MFS/spermidine synthase [Catenulispora sp.]|nr:fused MFS/spermidine synthase [Catenulispora sp.]